MTIAVLRGYGLISRTVIPCLVDPAGPEVAVPHAQRIGRCAMRFALLPHAGGWSEAGGLFAVGGHPHPPLGPRGASRRVAVPPQADRGPSRRGPGGLVHRPPPPRGW